MVRFLCRGVLQRDEARTQHDHCQHEVFERVGPDNLLRAGARGAAVVNTLQRICNFLRGHPLARHEILRLNEARDLVQLPGFDVIPVDPDISRPVRGAYDLPLPATLDTVGALQARGQLHRHGRALNDRPLRALEDELVELLDPLFTGLIAILRFQDQLLVAVQLPGLRHEVRDLLCSLQIQILERFRASLRGVSGGLRLLLHVLQLAERLVASDDVPLVLLLLRWIILTHGGRVLVLLSLLLPGGGSLAWQQPDPLHARAHAPPLGAPKALSAAHTTCDLVARSPQHVRRLPTRGAAHGLACAHSAPEARCFGRQPRLEACSPLLLHRRRGGTQRTWQGA